MGLNANAIVSVAQVKEYLKLDGTSDVALIENIINGTSDLFERYTTSKFINVAVVETLDGSGSDKVFVEYCPVVSLTQVKIDDEIKTLTDFKINSRSGIIQWTFGTFLAGFQNIIITYQSGYGAAMANLPADLILAALKQCEYFYKRDGADFSTTFEQGLVLKAPSEMLSPTVRDMLSPYFRNKVL